MAKAKREEPLMSSKKIAGFIQGGKAMKASSKQEMTKATMYMSKELHFRAKVWAAENGTSISGMVSQGLEWLMGGKK